MKFSELIGFFKEGKAIARSHMKNLLEVALVDKHFDDKEYQLLKSLAKKYKVSEKELKKIQENPGDIKVEIPEEENERFTQFYELVNMMTIDNKILIEEESLCKIFARKFGYKHPGELVNAVAHNIRYGQPCDETKKRVKMLL